jgi:hypothetical protein
MSLSCLTYRGDAKFIQNLIWTINEGNKPFRRHGHRWEHSIKIDLRKIRESMVWIVFRWLRMQTSCGFLGTR